LDSWPLRVTSDPTDVGHAGKLVIRMDIKDVFNSKSSTEEITASRVHDTFRFASGTGSLGDETIRGDIGTRDDRCVRKE
jgi:hypothetical protein